MVFYKISYARILKGRDRIMASGRQEPIGEITVKAVDATSARINLSLQELGMHRV